MLPAPIRAAARWLVAAAALVAGTPAAAQALESVVMPGKVIAGHAKLEEKCESCHKRFDKGAQSRLCLDCHKDVAGDAAAQRGFHGRAPGAKGRDCRTCHTEHKGREAAIAAFDRAKFDHAATDFPLLGRHGAPRVECSSCHAAGRKWRQAPSACVECHRKDDVHKGSLGPRCADCHAEKVWKEARFDHSTSRFPLAGRHEKAPCKDCHGKGFKDTPRECAACHRKDDAHKGRFGAKCEACHDSRDWRNHFAHEKTKFALAGKHALAKCASCHKGPLYREPLPVKCAACHKGDDAHKGSLGDACERCHNERSWKTAAFDHDRDTRFALRFQHRNAKCESCHKPGTRAKLDTACVSCHDDKDPHKRRFGPKCESCHVDRDWKEIAFRHDRDTKFPLLGRHREAKCASCHTGDLHRDNAPRECVGCHRKDDAHAGQLGERCARCHGEGSWKQAPFDHSKSAFPLVGAHARVDCRQCHLTARFKDASRECASCHARHDVHKAALGTRCETCHNARSWKAWDFDHARRTKYPLEGRHAAVKCASCHSAPARGRVESSTACYACHRGDDTHGGAFGVQCERCHGFDGWKALRAGAGRMPMPRPGG